MISNRVKTTRDRAWRTIDGNPLHAWVVAISELHEAVFSDHLTRALGVDWQRRPRGRDRNPAWEITGVPQTLAEEFSGRSRDINEVTDRLIEEYVASHGRRPRRSTIMKPRLHVDADLDPTHSQLLHQVAQLLYRGIGVLQWHRTQRQEPVAVLGRRLDELLVHQPGDLCAELGVRPVAVLVHRDRHGLDVDAHLVHVGDPDIQDVHPGLDRGELELVGPPGCRVAVAQGHLPRGQLRLLHEVGRRRTLSVAVEVGHGAIGAACPAHQIGPFGSGVADLKEVSLKGTLSSPADANNVAKRQFDPPNMSAIASPSSLVGGIRSSSRHDAGVDSRFRLDDTPRVPDRNSA